MYICIHIYIYIYIYIYTYLHACVYICTKYEKMVVSQNRGTHKSSNFIGCSIINHPFLGYPNFRKPPCIYIHGICFSTQHFLNPSDSTQ